MDTLGSSEDILRTLPFGETPRHPEVVIEAGQILLATGAKPSRPDRIPWDDPRVYDSVSINQLKKLPKRVAIVTEDLSLETQCRTAESDVRAVRGSAEALASARKLPKASPRFANPSRRGERPRSPAFRAHTRSAPASWASSSRASSGASAAK